MNIDCPECGHNKEFDCDELPDNACDSNEVECDECECLFMVGWSAESELR